MYLHKILCGNVCYLEALKALTAFSCCEMHWMDFMTPFRLKAQIMKNPELHTVTVLTNKNNKSYIGHRSERAGRVMLPLG